VLTDLDIKQCMGCFEFWVESPGECASKDDSAEIRRSVNSSLLLFALPLILCLTSSILEETIDKMIPIVLPFFAVGAGKIYQRRGTGSIPFECSDLRIGRYSHS
jgi:multimeric flavodoxin WrbA